QLSRRLLAQDQFAAIGDKEKRRIRLPAAHLAYLVEARIETMCEQNGEQLGVEAVRLAHRDGFRQRLDRGLSTLLGLSRHRASHGGWTDICAARVWRWSRDGPRPARPQAAARACAPTHRPSGNPG